MQKMIDYPENLEPNIQSLDLFKLIEETGNIYKAIMIIGKRANLLSVLSKQELVSKLAEFSSITDSLEEIIENREQIEIAKMYEQHPKPTILALYEFQNKKFEWKGD